jgi:cytoplasmic iron level regulating protein YaaA (DUF328/UPF0246 family)
VLVLLPPSETKVSGGRGAALDLGVLSMPTLNPGRHTLIGALSALSPEAARRALDLGPTQDDELRRNATLWSSPTLPALRRYTGVLFDALDARSFTRAAKAKADARLMIGSALFGAVRATDPIPAYRLSGGSRLPGFSTLAALWRAELPAAIHGEAAGGLIVDLRSGIYRQLGRVPGALTVSVLTEAADGSRSVVSHFSKHHKGLLARALVTSRAEPDSAGQVARVANRAGLRCEVSGPHELVLLTD